MADVARQPSRADQEFVKNSKGQKVRNMCYDLKLKKNKGKLNNVAVPSPADIIPMKLSDAAKDKLIDESIDKCMDSINDMGPKQLGVEFDRKRAFTGEAFEIVAKSMSEEEIASLDDESIRGIWAATGQAFATASMAVNGDWELEDWGEPDNFGVYIYEHIESDTETGLASSMINKKRDMEEQN